MLPSKILKGQIMQLARRYLFTFWFYVLIISHILQFLQTARCGLVWIMIIKQLQNNPPVPLYMFLWLFTRNLSCIKKILLNNRPMSLYTITLRQKGSYAIRLFSSLLVQNYIFMSWYCKAFQGNTILGSAVIITLASDNQLPRSASSSPQVRISLSLMSNIVSIPDECLLLMLYSNSAGN